MIRLVAALAMMGCSSVSMGENGAELADSGAVELRDLPDEYDAGPIGAGGAEPIETEPMPEAAPEASSGFCTPSTAPIFYDYDDSGEVIETSTRETACEAAIRQKILRCVGECPEGCDTGLDWDNKVCCCPN